MPNSPKQPKRNYLDTMHRVIRGIGVVGKELSQKGPTVESRMKEAGFKKIYHHYGVQRWSRPGQEVARLLGLSKMSDWERRTIQQDAKNLDQKPESAQRRQIVLEEVQETMVELRKDPKMAPFWVDRLEKNLLANNRFSGGKHVSKEDVSRVVMMTSGIPNEVKHYLRARFEGLEQYEEQINERGTTQAEIAGKLKALQGKRVLDKREVEAADRSLGVRSLESEEEKIASGSVHKSRWNISALTGWGRRSQGGEGGRGINTKNSA